MRRSTPKEIEYIYCYKEVIMPNQLGKRYQCEKCGTMVLCTKAGEGGVLCCGEDMGMQDPRKLPSSD
ncbi:MAG: hypothetical protein FI727_06125 [SAR202 cluster bacterium]|nr:hypothetical protein [SAR202 cluster bacterium]|tara:strand:- start:1855 stop:2055 length:201 start_codon:yes stop_codon:yes gene_type:complete